ncbi:MAG: class I SAM-dependent methyltransferase [Candidatus Bathyarchaeota archaeon]
MFLAPFVATPISVVRRMLVIAELKPDEILFDLGSGDGRAVIMAASDFGAKSVGVELRDDLSKKALTSIQLLEIAEKPQIIQRDIFDVDLSSADVVFLYLTTSANERIKPKLESELKSGTRVVSHDYEILGWEPIKVENFCENPELGYPSHTLYVYKR